MQDPGSHGPEVAHPSPGPMGMWQVTSHGPRDTGQGRRGPKRELTS